MTPQEREIVLRNPFRLPGLATEIEEQVGAFMSGKRLEPFPEQENRDWVINQRSMAKDQLVEEKERRIHEALGRVPDYFTQADFEKVCGYRGQTTANQALRKLVAAGILIRQRYAKTRAYLYWKAS
jgi:hypothetical protein